MCKTMIKIKTTCLDWHCQSVTQAWGLLRRFPPFRYFPIFSTSPKYMLAIEYHVHIWQVSPQLSCGDTCQIWMKFKECNRYYCQIENFAYGEIDERNFSNPHSWSESLQVYAICLFKYLAFSRSTPLNFSHLRKPVHPPVIKYGQHVVYVWDSGY